MCRVIVNLEVLWRIHRPAIAPNMFALHQGRQLIVRENKGGRQNIGFVYFLKLLVAPVEDCGCAGIGGRSKESNQAP